MIGKAETAERAGPEALEGVLDESPVSAREIAISLGCLALAFGIGIRAITSGLWLDETGTYWVIRDGLGSVFNRCPLGSVAYYVAAWAGSLLRPIAGFETALRLPSVLATMAAGWLLFQLGRRLLGRRAALIAVVAFFCLYDVASAMLDARPYALGLLLLLASMFSLVKWLDSSDWRYAILYVAASALLVYTHYLLVLGLAPQLVYAWREKHKMLLLWVGVAVLCLPLAIPLLTLYHARQEHAYLPKPVPLDLFRALAPPTMTATIFLAAILGRASRRLTTSVPRIFLMVWAFFPPVILFAVSYFHDFSLFLPRYCLSSAPAIALLAGWILSRISPAWLASMILLAGFVFAYGGAIANRGGDDWRAADAMINAQFSPNDVVLVASGFAEATPQEINRSDAFFAPQVAYPIPKFGRLPASPIPTALPADFGGAKHVLLLVFDFQMQYADWNAQKLPGCHERLLGRFGRLQVIRFDR